MRFVAKGNAAQRGTRCAFNGCYSACWRVAAAGVPRSVTEAAAKSATLERCRMQFRRIFTPNGLQCQFGACVAAFRRKRMSMLSMPMGTERLRAIRLPQVRVTA